MLTFALQGVGHNDDKVLILAATNTPYSLDQVELCQLCVVHFVVVFLFFIF